MAACQHMPAGPRAVFVQAEEEACVPQALLFLQHWHPPLVLAAHTLCAALLERSLLVRPLSVPRDARI